MQVNKKKNYSNQHIEQALRKNLIKRKKFQKKYSKESKKAWLSNQTSGSKKWLSKKKW